MTDRLNKKNDQADSAKSPEIFEHPGYAQVNRTSLLTLSTKELCKIIYRYDYDAHCLNKELKAERQAKTALQSELEDLQERLVCVKINSDSAASALLLATAEAKQKDSVVTELAGKLSACQAELVEKDQLIRTQKEHIAYLSSQIIGIEKFEELNALLNQHLKTTDIGPALNTSKSFCDQEVTAFYHKVQSLLQTSRDLEAQAEHFKKQHQRLHGLQQQQLQENLKLKRKVARLTKELSHTQASVRARKFLLNKRLSTARVQIHGLTTELQMIRVQLCNFTNLFTSNAQQTLLEQIRLTMKNQAQLTQELRETNKAKLALDVRLVEARANIQQLKNQLTSSAGRPLKSSQSFLAIKTELERLYKRLMVEINRSVDGNSSFYSMKSPQFSSIERDLNNLILLVHENLEGQHTEEKKTHRLKQERRSSETFSDKLFACVSPRNRSRRTGSIEFSSKDIVSSARPTNRRYHY